MNEMETNRTEVLCTKCIVVKIKLFKTILNLLFQLEFFFLFDIAHPPHDGTIAGISEMKFFRVSVNAQRRSAFTVSQLGFCVHCLFHISKAAAASTAAGAGGVMKYIDFNGCAGVREFEPVCVCVFGRKAPISVTTEGANSTTNVRWKRSSARVEICTLNRITSSLVVRVGVDVFRRILSVRLCVCVCFGAGWCTTLLFLLHPPGSPAASHKMRCGVHRDTGNESA